MLYKKQDPKTFFEIHSVKSENQSDTVSCTLHSLLAKSIPGHIIIIAPTGHDLYRGREAKALFADPVIVADMCFFVALVSAILLIRQFGHFQKGRAAGVKLSGSCRPDSLDHIPAPLRANRITGRSKQPLGGTARKPSRERQRSRPALRENAVPTARAGGDGTRSRKGSEERRQLL